MQAAALRHHVTLLRGYLRAHASQHGAQLGRASSGVLYTIRPARSEASFLLSYELPQCGVVVEVDKTQPAPVIHSSTHQFIITH